MENIKDDYVTYDVAKLLDEVGFDEVCNAYYHDDKLLRFALPSRVGSFIPLYYINSSRMWKPLFAGKKRRGNCHMAPTQSLVLKWLRVKHNIVIVPMLYRRNPNDYIVGIYYGNNESHFLGGKNTETVFDAPENATELAIIYTLKNFIK